MSNMQMLQTSISKYALYIILIIKGSNNDPSFHLKKRIFLDNFPLRNL